MTQRMGWVCPKCNAALSPDEKRCDCVAGLRWSDPQTTTVTVPTVSIPNWGYPNGTVGGTFTSTSKIDGVLT